MQIRFAWWGAEELGILGSQYYVSKLSPPERNNISLYLNFDMLVCHMIVILRITNVGLPFTIGIT